MNYRIWLSDLRPEVQMDIADQLRHYLLSSGEIDPQDEEEDNPAYERRVMEEVDHYLNTHNYYMEIEVCQTND